MLTELVVLDVGAQEGAEVVFPDHVFDVLEELVALLVLDLVLVLLRIGPVLNFRFEHSAFGTLAHGCQVHLHGVLSLSQLSPGLLCSKHFL